MKTRQMIVAACLLGLAVPACADGILEQMENEVTAIARRTKSAVVTIEDSRALLVAYDTSPLERADLTDRIAHLEIDKKTYDDRLARAEGQYRAGMIDAVTLADARGQAEHVTRQLAAEQRNLEQLGRVTPLQRQRQEVTDSLALLAIDKHAVEMKVNVEDQRYRAGAATQAELEAPRAELAHLQQEINAQTARAAILDQLIRQADAVRRVAGNPTDKPTDGQRAYQDAVTWYERKDANANPPRSGTGFSIGEGFIVTTADVLDGMNNPVVITDSGVKIRARVVAVDTEMNVGMVKLAAQADIPALTLGNSSGVAAGCFAISIGNQHGNANAVALDLVAGIKTEATYSGDHFYPSLIQFGGTVGAGTSGAPLVNSHGQVIGIIAGVPQAEPEPGQYLYVNSPPQSVQPPAPPSGSPAQYGVIYSRAMAAGPAQSGTQRRATLWAKSGALRSAFLRTVVAETGYRRSAKRAGHAHKLAANGTRASLQSAQARREPERNRNRPPIPAAAAPVGLGWVLASSRNAIDYPYQTYNLVATTANLQTLDLKNNTLTNGLNLPVRPAPVVASSGFAIPIDEVQSVLMDMKAGRPIVHGWIGVDLENQERGTEQNGIVKVVRTVRVKGVYVNSPANRVGVTPGDILISLDDKALHTISDVRIGIMRSTLNRPVTLTFDHQGRLETCRVAVEPRPTQTGKVITASAPVAAPAGSVK